MTFSIGDEETARSLVQLFGKSQQQRISRSKSKMGGGAGSMGRATSGESIQEERTRKFFTTLAHTDTAVRIRKASFVNGYLFFAVCYYVDSYIDRTIKTCEETAKKTLNQKIQFCSFQGPLEDFYQKQEEVL
ncbi:MAG: hypothetical protein R6W70_00115 [bacterium]